MNIAKEKTTMNIGEALTEIIKENHPHLLENIGKFDKETLLQLLEALWRRISTASTLYVTLAMTLM
jgi:hypothetical protein